MSSLILGMGPGLFAVVLTAAIAILLALVISYLYPDYAVYVFAAFLLLPLLVFGILMSAKEKKTYDPTRMIGDDDVEITDSMYAVRVLLLVLFAISIAAYYVYHYVFEVLYAPPFLAPHVTTRRRHLESSHPTWFR